jgi:hypothetical protein
VEDTMKNILLPLVLSAGFLSLTGCGGGGGSNTAMPVSNATTGTTITGNVVKGPLNGSQVCAYLVTANSKGAATGSCVLTDSNGLYALNVPVLLGDLLIEASGGSYTDEVTGATTALPSGSVMTGLIAANGGSAVAMLTPFTTMAINSAIASNALSSAGYQTALSQVQTGFSLPLSLNLASTPPTFGVGMNAYGTALTVLSTMISNGTSLSALLAGVASPSVLSAYATAATGGGTPPVVVGPPTTAGAVSATGTLTLTGAGNNFTPAPTGFEVVVEANKVEYKFTRPVTYPNGSTSTARVEIDNSSPNNPTVYYFDAQVSFSTYYSCASNCGITFSTPAGASHPVTVTFTNTPLSGGRTLSGSLTGEVSSGAAWAIVDLPRSTMGQLTLAGTAAPVKSGSYTVAGATLSASVLLSDGSSLSIGNTNGGSVMRVAAAGVVTQATLIQICNANCGVTMVESSTGLNIIFANSLLAPNVALNGTVFIGKTLGTLTAGSLGNFTPVSDSVSSTNDTLKTVFSVLGTSAQSGISLLTVDVRGSAIIGVTAVTGIGTGLSSCYETAFALGGIPACAGGSVSADRRTVTFSNLAMSGGVALNGTLTARGQ